MHEHSTQTNSPARFVFFRAVLSMALLWLSFPPIGFSILGWLALVPLLHLTVDERLVTKNGFRKIWAAALLYWLATFYFIPIPHPALWAGWLVISIYLACYLPVFVFSARTLNQSLRVPFLLAIPVCWTGLEYLRCHLFTGMGLVCLSHTQYQFPVFIQISDLSGAYTLTFAITFVAAAVCQLRWLFRGSFATAAVHLVLGGAMVGGVYFYGNSKINQPFPANIENLNIGLIQGSIDTVFPDTEEAYYEFQENKNQHYLDLYRSAAQQWDDVDVVIWPENGWPVPDLHPDTNTEDMDPRRLDMYRESEFYAWNNLFVRGKATPEIIAGALTVDPLKNDRFGSAIHIGVNGEVKNRYYKNHLVMFGEYVPLADWFPLLRRIPAIGEGLVAGTHSTNFEVAGARLAPSICFESTVPHYVRRQVLDLQQNDHSPDILVNVTNDGWFYGTSCLDFHLACNVFRAVEMRKPMLVCANTGLSAHIDEHGSILQQGPRRESKAILAKVSTSEIESPYLAIGDWIPFAFLLVTIFGFVLGLVPRKKLVGENQVDGEMAE